MIAPLACHTVWMPFERIGVDRGSETATRPLRVGQKLRISSVELKKLSTRLRDKPTRPRGHDGPLVAPRETHGLNLVDRRLGMAPGRPKAHFMLPARRLRRRPPVVAACAAPFLVPQRLMAWRSFRRSCASFLA